MVIDPRPKEICNEYAIQTMFCQSQTYPTENKPFFYFQKKSQNFKIWLQKSQIGNPTTQELRMRIKYCA